MRFGFIIFDGVKLGILCWDVKWFVDVFLDVLFDGGICCLFEDMFCLIEVRFIRLGCFGFKD